MTSRLQFKRYDSNTVSRLIGANGELIIDTTNKTITVHDGLTIGGSRLATESFALSHGGGGGGSSSSLISGSYTASLSSINGSLTLPNTLIFADSTQQNTAFNGYATDNTARTIAQAAYNQANTGGIDSYARTTANTASNNITVLQGEINSANANIALLFAIDAVQNTSIAAVNTYAYSAYAAANLAGSSANTLLLQSAMSSANANISYLFGIVNTQNTSVASVNTYAYSAYTQANSASSNTIYLQGALNSTNANTVAINTYAYSAYTTANIGKNFINNGGTIQGNVIINGSLSVSGNITYTGNVTTQVISGNTGQFFGYSGNGFNALYTGIPTGYLLEQQIVNQFTANYNGYAGGVNIQNINSGANASGDLFISADNGTINDGFLDIGLGSSTYNYPGYNLIGKNDGYWIVAGNTTTGGGNMILSTGFNNDIIFAQNGTNQGNEVARFKAGSGLVLRGIPLQFSDGTVQNTAGSSVANTVYLQGGLNTANANISYLFAIDTVQNTSITAVNTYSYSAYTQANSASSNTVYLQGGLNTANANSTLLFGYLNSANANIALLQGSMSSSNANIALLFAIDTVQNTSITAVNTYSYSAYTQANSASTLAQAAFNQANTSGGSPIDQYARNTANSASILAQASFNEANSAYSLASGSLQSAFTAVAVGGTNQFIASGSDTINFIAGSSVSISACSSTKSITFSASSGGGGSGGTFNGGYVFPIGGQMANYGLLTGFTVPSAYTSSSAFVVSTFDSSGGSVNVVYDATAGRNFLILTTQGGGGWWYLTGYGAGGDSFSIATTGQSDYVGLGPGFVVNSTDIASSTVYSVNGQAFTFNSGSSYSLSNPGLHTTQNNAYMSFYLQSSYYSTISAGLTAGSGVTMYLDPTHYTVWFKIPGTVWNTTGTVATYSGSNLGLTSYGQGIVFGA